MSEEAVVVVLAIDVDERLMKEMILADSVTGLRMSSFFVGLSFFLSMTISMDHMELAEVVVVDVVVGGVMVVEI